MSAVICRLDELLDRGSRAFAIGEGAWPLRGFIVRDGSDVRAYVNRCPHAGHPLNLRPHEFLTPDRHHILCNSHGAMFDIATGRCVAGPCPGQALTPLPIRIEGGLVLLDADVGELARIHA